MVLAFYCIPFPVTVTVPWLLGGVFTLPVTLSFQFIKNLDDNMTDLREYLNTTEINRYHDAVAPIQVMLYVYFWSFISFGVFVAWACFMASAPYANITLPIAVGMTFVGVRFLMVLLKRHGQLAKIKDQFKANAEHVKKLSAMESEIG